jgi:hypothetical protein
MGYEPTTHYCVGRIKGGGFYSAPQIHLTAVTNRGLTATATY